MKDVQMFDIVYGNELGGGEQETTRFGGGHFTGKATATRPFSAFLSPVHMTSRPFRYLPLGRNFQEPTPTPLAAYQHPALGHDISSVSRYPLLCNIREVSSPLGNNDPISELADWNRRRTQASLVMTRQ